MALKSRRRLQGAAEGVGQKRTADALASFRDILRSCRSGISRKTWCTFPSGDQRKSRCYNVRGKDTPMRSLHRGEPPRQEFASDLDEIARQGARKMLIQKPERAKGRASSHRPRIVVDGLVPWRLGGTSRGRWACADSILFRGGSLLRSPWWVCVGPSQTALACSSFTEWPSIRTTLTGALPKSGPNTHPSIQDVGYTSSRITTSGIPLGFWQGF